ncbi:MAG: type I restriction endonuclease subunit R, partial [Planctomycetota bacterium]
EEGYRLMVVANKFQTGFDQPLLAGMFLDKAVADRNAVQTVSRLNRRHPGKDGVVVVDFTNNAKAILKAFHKYRHGSPHDPDEPDPQACYDLRDEILAEGLFTADDAAAVVCLIQQGNDARLQSRANELRQRFLGHFDSSDERKTYAYLFTKFSRVYRFLTSFFAFEEDVDTFATFCEFIETQLIKSGSVSDLMKQIRATVVEKAAVTSEGEVQMPANLRKPRPRKGGGGGSAIPKVSLRDMIDRIRRDHDITDDEALHIREVSQEKIKDATIRQTIETHRLDRAFLEGVYRGQVNGSIQDAYALRELFEQLGDPKYTEPGAIFDIMAFTVIEKNLSEA